jgi:hypothetical protein
MATFEKPLTIGKTDTYTYTVPSEWLGSNTITAHDVTVDALVTKNNSGVTGNVIAASISGVTAGNSNVHFDYTTSDGRTDCANVTVKVTADC